jgi:hypothetical protein
MTTNFLSTLLKATLEDIAEDIESEKNDESAAPRQVPCVFLCVRATVRD